MRDIWGGHLKWDTLYMYVLFVIYKPLIFSKKKLDK